MIADRRRNKSDLVGLRTPLSRFRENVLRRNDARGIVIVSGPAESTALRAAARYLDEEAISHLRARRPDRRRRTEDLLVDEKFGKLLFTALHRPTQRTFFRVDTRESTADTPRHAFVFRDVI